jgi:hypothetical protein
MATQKICKNCGHELIRTGLKRKRIWGHKAISATTFKPIGILECIEGHDPDDKRKGCRCINPEEARA